MNATRPSETIPVLLRPVVAKARERIDEHQHLAAALGADAKVSAELDRVLACSEYAADVIARYPQALIDIIADARVHRPLELSEYESLFLSSGTADDNETAFLRRLRLFRHRELLRIIFRDLAGWSDCEETLAEISALADTCIRAAFLRSSMEMENRYGRPIGISGEDACFIIVAMGKLGGGELNFSSDIDVVFFFSEPGETNGRRAMSNEEYFRRLAQHFINLLSKKTADGFVYRVDARLRPFGDSGPLACSVDAFEDYLAQQGRDWERYAWVKARAVNVWEGTKDFYINVLRPFVYRRYLDFGVFSSLREMKALIEREARAAENRENIKLGPGGIREIEFIVQTLQLVRGGTLRSLRERRLLTALEHLADEELMPAETAVELAEAYRYLRTLENRIQMIADRQTHELPDDELDRARVTLAMRAVSWDELYQELDAQRAVVKNDFEQILRHERPGVPSASGSDQHAPGDAPSAFQSIAEQIFADPEEPIRRLEALRESSLYRRMDAISRERLDRLLPNMLLACGAAGNAELALERMLNVVESIGRRSAYIALLNENNAALERLVKLCSASAFLARQVAAHPLLLDELLDQRVFQEAPEREDLDKDLRHRLNGVVLEDTEQRFEALRNFQQAAVFRVAVADLSATLPLMRVSDRLTDIAELVLGEALEMALAELVAKHGVPCCVVDGAPRRAGFAVAGYGKMGGLELGYGSDLDIVFVHASAGEAQLTDGERPLDNSVFFGRLARRITNILTMPTPTGPLYEVDTRLRPSGKSGLLVTSLQAFDTYQKDDAWTWEHQALMRARAVAGDKTVCQEFEELRIHALTEYVRRDTLLEEVVKMRDRMRSELDKSSADEFDIKQGKGGVIDIEFLVQYLVLLNAGEHPAVLRYSDNIRQLEALEGSGILPGEEANGLADAYREYRSRMHLLSLGGHARLAANDEFQESRQFVERLWRGYMTD